jgi:NADH-quinone oxidoreductase subunit E
LLEKLCHANGIHPYGTTPDGDLTIEPAECLGACDFAPCILANDDLLKNMTPEAAEAELKKPRARAT